MAISQTASNAAPHAHAPMQVGNAVRNRRRLLGMTLEDLAGHSGVSRAMISEIERNGKSPTVRVLSQIATGLGCNITELLGDAEDGGIELIHENEYQRVVDPESRVERTSLAPRLARHGIELVRYRLPPRALLCKCPARSASDLVAIHVTKGALRVRIGDQEIDVQNGESLTYVPDVEADLLNASRGETVAVFVLDSSQSRA